jgi:alkylhydroperoxidase family enzyme
METQLNYSMAMPGSTRAMSRLHKDLEESGLERLLLDLVQMPLPQSSGCDYCPDMQAKDARAFDESGQYR